MSGETLMWMSYTLSEVSVAGSTSGLRSAKWLAIGFAFRFKWGALDGEASCTRRYFEKAT
jgi:hypothetical protein